MKQVCSYGSLILGSIWKYRIHWERGTHHSQQQHPRQSVSQVPPPAGYPHQRSSTTAQHLVRWGYLLGTAASTGRQMRTGLNCCRTCLEGSLPRRAWNHHCNTSFTSEVHSRGRCMRNTPKLIAQHPFLTGPCCSPKH